MELIRENVNKSQAGRRSAIEGEHFENALETLSRNPKATVEMHKDMDPNNSVDRERHNSIVSQARAIANGFRGGKYVTVEKNRKGSPHDFTKKDALKNTITDIDVKVSQQKRKRQLKVGTFTAEKDKPSTGSTEVSTEVSTENPKTFYKTVHSIAKDSPGFENLRHVSVDSNGTKTEEPLNFNSNQNHRTFENLRKVLDHVENHPDLKSEDANKKNNAHRLRRRLRAYFAKIPSEQLDNPNYKAKLIGVRPDSKRKGRVKVTVIDKKEHIDAPDNNFLGTSFGNKSLSHGRFRFSQDGENVVIHLRHQHPKKSSNKKPKK